ncbi:MAG: RIP metalloprotease RseP [Leptolyngbya foveolarum]|uniref:Zinc metalloprotease n=1 Tax=Leptolyngbya foveolarum TaxID=47253 RepID=A0A2W4UQM9_9CYAN|nr:MAG: RIP metalloprotease RseP [Leptolyngbya foveolarum]
MTVLAVIGVLALLIFVHELGHFMAARLQKIHVNRFSIGFGPILWKFQGPETEYALRAIPLGGFVGFPDDDPESEIPPNDPDLLRNRPVLDRAIVISAGVIANMVFAYLVFVLQFGILGVPEPVAGVYIPQVVAQSPADLAGIQNGDVVIAANAQRLDLGEGVDKKLIGIIHDSPNQSVNLTLQRKDKELDVAVTPQVSPTSGEAVIGISLSTVAPRPIRNPIELLSIAAVQFQEQTKLVAGGMLALFTNFSEMSGQVGSPVKIVEQGAKLSSENIRFLFPFAAIISINLAMINILPLPALDGGQLAFLLIEAIRGKPLPMRLQESVMQTGIFLLLGLGIFLIIRDTTQLEVLQNLR